MIEECSNPRCQSMGCCHPAHGQKLETEIDFRTLRTDHEDIVLTHVYRGCILKTQEGNTLAVCMRDGSFEVKYNDGPWFPITNPPKILKPIATQPCAHCKTDMTGLGIAGLIVQYGGGEFCSDSCVEAWTQEAHEEWEKTHGQEEVTSGSQG